MNQNIWGPKFWFTLHTVSFEYPINPTQQDKKIYYNYYDSYKYLLPCSVCRKNYKINLKELPLINSLNSRRDLVHWVIDIHNKVNTETGKRLYSYEEAIKLYEKLLNRKINLNNNKNNNEINAYTTRLTSKKYVHGLLALFIILLILALIRLYQLFKKK